MRTGLVRTVVASILLASASVALTQDVVLTDREGARPLALPDGEDSFHFVVFGDRTGGPREGLDVLRQAVRDTNLISPDLVMTVGDLVQGYNERPEWLEQMREYGGIMDGLAMRWYPVAGNHDVYWRGGDVPHDQHEGDYEEHFGPLWYSFRHKSAAFVVLYSDEGDSETGRKGWGDAKVNRMSERQLEWLSRTLEEHRDARHVFLFLHHPRWWSEYYQGTNWDAVHERLVAAGNVSAVFAGHIHRRRYDGARDGIEYYALATTGGGIPFDVPGTGHMHHLDVVTVRGDDFSIASIPIGKTLDPKELTPERWKEIDALRAMPFAHLDPFEIGGDGAAAGTYRLRASNPTQRPVRFEIALRGGDRATWFTRREATLEVAPGESAEAAFPYEREPRGLDDLEVPRVETRVVYLAESFPVALPSQSLPCAVRLRDLPDEVYAARDGAALHLDGRSCLRVASADLALPDGPFTVEGWIRGDAYAGRRAYLAKTESSEFGLFVSDGKPSFSVFLGDGYVTAESAEPLLAAGRWHHVAGVFDGQEVRVYVDGKRVAARAGAGRRRRNAQPFLIGADPDGRGRPNSLCKGWVDEVRVSTVARYDADFAPSRRHEPDADTALLLHLDRTLGPFAPDHAAGAHHATLVGRAEIGVADGPR